MRAIRGLTVAALLALSAGTAAAQASRGFKDSWFWGLKSGVLSYQVQQVLTDTSTTSISQNPLALLGGIDWVITRSNGGLYFSFDHSFMAGKSVFVNDSISPLDTVPRVVRLKGLRRFTIAGMLFPMQTYRLHPYVGLGVTLSNIASALPLGTYRNGTQATLVESTVQAFRSAATPVVMLGTQLRLPLVSGFGQVTLSPSNSNFFLFTGSGWRTTLEGGLRYNVGSSIDRTR